MGRLDRPERARQVENALADQGSCGPTVDSLGRHGSVPGLSPFGPYPGSQGHRAKALHSKEFGSHPESRTHLHIHHRALGVARFTPPWTVHSNASCFWVEDQEGHRFAYTYRKAEPDRVMGQLTRDEARRLAVNFARLPDLLQKARSDG